MDPPPAELDAESLGQKFAPQFEAMENLRDYAWTHRPRGSGTGVQRYQGLIFALFARATLTYRAVLHLCRGGYTEQANMLNRSLFEDMAHAHWVSLPAHQEEAVELLHQHTDYSALLARDSIEKHKDWLAVSGELSDLSELEAKREEYQRLFGRYGEKSWTRKDIYSIVKEIEPLWPDEKVAKRELWGFYSLGHRINNQKVHTSSFSLNAQTKVARFEAGLPVFRFSASPTDDEKPMIVALYGALFTYGRITRLLISETGAAVDAFDDFYRRQLGMLEELAPSKRDKIKRNDPCPCESGKKYKVCHGGSHGNQIRTPGA